ncbi:MAG TPA: DUF4062 domain-containing protein [Thermoanaerobaculia bacterium]|nr:DUF4062 domain-containing protein [Thermoanaerobaculia bacterium]
MADIPTVFLSSTFYDLRQVRANLVEFVENQFGYRVLASELASFPIDPSADTVENCRRRVDEQADILVLIIGGRYGSVSESHGKSVTNLEYLVARAKGIPIYCFVDRNVLAVLPTWEANPGADFSATVDSSDLFVFLRRVRTGDRVWMFPFDTAQEIVGALRSQFAHLMQRGLIAECRLRSVDPVLRTLSGPALRLAIDRPIGWQLKLLAQVLIDEVERASDQRRAHDVGIAFGVGQVISHEAVADWVSEQFARPVRLLAGLSTLFNPTMTVSVATEDAAQIVFGARQAGQAYSEALDWAAALRKTTVPDDWLPLLKEMPKLIDDILTKLEDAGPRLMRLVDEAIEMPPEIRKPINFTITINLSNEEAFYRELETLKKSRGKVTQSGPP